MNRPSAISRAPWFPNPLSRRRWVGLAAVAAFLSITGLCRASAAEDPERREWTIDGVVREALVYAPGNAKSTPAPLIFAFHGHGGTMQHAARSFNYHGLWPEAIVVYPQGLKTPGRLVDPQGLLPGWQSGPGDQGDRDLKFFDAMLAALRQDYKIDEKRIYVTGHSNGGGFTYLLWAERGDVFTAVAPCAAATILISQLKPKPILHLAGENDPLVKFEWQKLTIDAVRRVNQCGEGKPWEEPLCTIYPSSIGAPVVTYIHPGKHNVPPGATAVIVKFFKEQVKP